MQNLTKPNALANTFCNSGDKTGTIPTADTGTNAASLAKGFPAITSTAISQGGIPPKRTDFNGILNLLSQYCFFMQNGGKFEFDATVATDIGGYPAGAILNYTDSEGNEYQIKSLIDNNTNAPTSSNIRVSASQTGTFYWKLVSSNFMPGATLSFVGAVVPDGWLLCDGSAVSRTTYSFLFATIGTKYGSGDGTTTFNLPDFREKTFWGGTTSDVGTVLTSALPNIKGTMTNICNRQGSASGALSFSSASGNNRYASNSVSDLDNVNFNAHNSNSIYKDGQTIVQPPAIKTLIIIKV